MVVQESVIVWNESFPINKDNITSKVKGRIDHMDINLKDQTLYVAALGNNTVGNRGYEFHGKV